MWRWDHLDEEAGNCCTSATCQLGGLGWRGLSSLRTLVSFCVRWGSSWVTSKGLLPLSFAPSNSEQECVLCHLAYIAVLQSKIVSSGKCHVSACCFSEVYKAHGVYLYQLLLLIANMKNWLSHMRKAEGEALPWMQKWHHYCVHNTQTLDVPEPFSKEAHAQCLSCPHFSHEIYG